MTERASGWDGSDQVRGLVDRLVALRDECAELPEEQRVQRLGEELDRNLEGLPPESAQAMVDRAYDQLVTDARQRQDRIDQLAREVESLRSQLADASEENQQLQRQLNEQRSQVQALSNASMSDAAIEVLRIRLKAMVREESTPVSADPLRAEDARLFELLEELLRFAIELDWGVRMFLMGHQVGPVGDTLQMRALRQQVRQRFVDCLESGDQESLEALRAVLERNRKFLILLNEAYSAAIPRGTKAILEELSPEAVRKESKGKRFSLTNFEQLFNLLKERHQQLVQLPPDELLMRYFTECFQQELHERLG